MYPGGMKAVRAGTAACLPPGSPWGEIPMRRSLTGLGGIQEGAILESERTIDSSTEGLLISRVVVVWQF